MSYLSGVVAPGFESVAEVFKQNFVAQGEFGAALTIELGGTSVVDIYAGHYSNKILAQEDALWQRDTLVNVYSASKGFVALAILCLVDQGLLDIDQPIAEYWPEFAAGGKSLVTVRQVLCHRSGVSAFTERLKDSDIFHWQTMMNAIENATPWWQPNSAQGYSPFIYGWILGEVVRRKAGTASFKAYFDQQIAEPLALQGGYGLNALQLGKVADTRQIKRPSATTTMEGIADSASLGKLMKQDARGVTNRAFANPLSLMTSSNQLAWREAVIPAANAHVSAPDMAKIYSAILSNKFLSAIGRERCSEILSSGQDNVLGVPLVFGHGFMLSQARKDCCFGPSPRAFGHPGAGGSIGFADPDRGLSFSYVTAGMGQNVLMDQRAILLVDALYQLKEIN